MLTFTLLKNGSLVTNDNNKCTLQETYDDIKINFISSLTKKYILKILLLRVVKIKCIIKIINDDLGKPSSPVGENALTSQEKTQYLSHCSPS